MHVMQLQMTGQRVRHGDGVRFKCICSSILRLNRFCRTPVGRAHYITVRSICFINRPSQPRRFAFNFLLIVPPVRPPHGVHADRQKTDVGQCRVLLLRRRGHITFHRLLKPPSHVPLIIEKRNCGYYLPRNATVVPLNAKNHSSVYIL